MASRSVTVAVALTGLAALGAIGSFVQMGRLRSDAGSLLSQGHAEAQEYAATFNGAYADQQAKTLDARRKVLERSHGWQRAGVVLVLFTVVGGFTSYLLYLLHRLREQLLDAEAELTPAERELSEARSSGH